MLRAGSFGLRTGQSCGRMARNGTWWLPSPSGRRRGASSCVQQVAILVLRPRICRRRCDHLSLRSRRRGCREPRGGRIHPQKLVFPWGGRSRSPRVRRAYVLTLTFSDTSPAPGLSGAGGGSVFVKAIAAPDGIGRRRPPDTRPGHGPVLHGQHRTRRAAAVRRAAVRVRGDEPVRRRPLAPGAPEVRRRPRPAPPRRPRGWPSCPAEPRSRR